MRMIPWFLQCMKCKLGVLEEATGGGNLKLQRKSEQISLPDATVCIPREGGISTHNVLLNFVNKVPKGYSPDHPSHWHSSICKHRLNLVITT